MEVALGPNTQEHFQGLREALRRKRRHFVIQIPSFITTMQGVTPLLMSRTTYAADNGRFWIILRTHPI